MVLLKLLSTHFTRKARSRGALCSFCVLSIVMLLLYGNMSIPVANAHGKSFAPPPNWKEFGTSHRAAGHAPAVYFQCYDHEVATRTLPNQLHGQA